MSCGHFRSALRDVALGQAASPDLKRHLASCESCRHQVKRDRLLADRIERQIEQVLAIEASSQFVARVRACLPEAEVGAPWSLRWWVPAALGAAVLVLALLAVDRTPCPPSPLAVPPDTQAATSGPAREEVAPQGSTRPPPAESMVPSSAVAPLVAEASASPGATLRTATAAPAAGSVAAALARPAQTPTRNAPQVLIPARDIEATRRFLAARHRWRVWRGTPAVVITAPRGLISLEIETLQVPAVVQWDLEAQEPGAFAVQVLDSWPLVPGD